MSELMPYQSAIQGAKERFAKNATTVSYDRESIFAMQALMKTDFAMDTANRNPQSVRLAMINVASTGLTLNPANAYAYLVPRDGAIVLDISYKGLIKIATDAGSIEWARAACVYSADQFTYHGPATIPDHVADPFRKDRGEVIGVYCIAKTTSGDILTEVMPMTELEKIRDKSQAYAKKKSGPWVEWFEQMAKKAVIKRASKTWPYTDKNDRLSTAIEVANQSEGGYDFDNEEEQSARRKLACEAAFGRNLRSAAYILAELDKPDPDLHGVAEAWAEIPEADQMLMWLAPTKGGIFTTAQRRTIKEGLPNIKAEEAA